MASSLSRQRIARGSTHADSHSNVAAGCDSGGVRSSSFLGAAECRVCPHISQMIEHFQGVIGKSYSQRSLIERLADE